ESWFLHVHCPNVANRHIGKRVAGMVARFWRLGGALLLIGTLMATGIGHAPAVAQQSGHVWQPPGVQYVRRTDGEWIVWIDGRDAGEYPGEYEIFGAHLADGEEFVIAPGLVRRAYADVQDDVAVWAEEIHNELGS